MGGILGRSSAKLPSSIRCGVNALKDTLETTKALQQLSSSISSTKRNCWSTHIDPNSSAKSGCNQIPIDKQKQKGESNILDEEPSSSRIDSSTYQRRKKDKIKNKAKSPDDMSYGKISSIDSNENSIKRSLIDFPLPNQDTLPINEKRFHLDEGIMEVKRQMASVRHEVSKVSLKYHIIDFLLRIMKDGYLSNI